MPSWSALPMEMRGEIVKRLDFRTRFRFRHVSKSNQELVDSVPLYIPRVVLEVKSKTMAKLTFWLGIRKPIDVGFVNTGGAETSVRVTETSNGHFIQHGAIRQVDSPDAPMLAFTALRNVAMNPNTFSGALELNITHHNELNDAQVWEVFGGRKFRTKILCMARGASNCLLGHMDIKELEEIRIMCEYENDLRKGAPMLTHTTRLRVRIDEENLKKIGHRSTFGWAQSYTIATDEELKRFVPMEKFQNDSIQSVQKIFADGDFMVYYEKEATGGPCYTRISSCGIAAWEPDFEVEVEAPTDCAMRWACPIHADPFDHWYMTTIVDCSSTLRTVFAKSPLWEMVFPVVNGMSFLDPCMQPGEEKEEEEEEEEEMKKDEALEKNPDNQWSILMILAFISLVFGLIAHRLLFV